jgi:hypothetical protein
MNNSAEQLLALQISQLEHDEFFHKEITRLNVHQRLNHMVLHFAKYCEILRKNLRLCFKQPRSRSSEKEHR